MIKKQLKRLTLFGLLGVLLVGCGTGNAVVKKDPPKETTQGEVSDPIQEQTVPAQKIASTIKLEYDFGTMKETVDANLWQGQKDYHIYLPDTVVGTQDPTGVDIIKTKEIPESSLEIQQLDKDTNITELIKSEKAKLQEAYPGFEIKSAELENKFSGKVLKSLSVTNDSQGTSIYIVEINDTVFKFTMHLWVSEQWEVTRFITMINSIIITPQGAAI